MSVDMHITGAFSKLCWLLVFYRFVGCLNFQKTSSVEETENSRPAYYKGDIRLPLIPPAVLSEFTNNEVVPFIMEAERFHGHLIASTNPVRVENNVCFLVDLDQLQEPEDLLSDDLGSWNQSKTAVKKYVLTTEKGDRITKITKQPDYAEGCYSVYCRTFVNKSDSSLLKTIVNLVHPDQGHHKLVFMR